MDANTALSNTSPTVSISKLSTYSTKLIVSHLMFRFLTCLSVTFLILLLPLYGVFSKLTFTTHFEESVGFRYFHSLRLLYGHENPWLPQGQLPGIFHFCIQKFLTFLGHPTDELFPRIDLFTNLAVFIPLSLSGVMFYWSAKPIKSNVFYFIFALIFVSCFYSPRLQNGWMMLPDYHIFIMTMSLIGIGWVLRIMPAHKIYTGYSNKSAVLLGLYAGTCLSIKYTLFTYPLSLALIFISFTRSKKILIKMFCISLPTSAITWLAILSIYYQGDFSQIPEYFKNLLAFSTSQMQFASANKSNFFNVFVPTNVIDLFPLIIIILSYQFLMFNKYKYKSTPSILILPVLLELYFLYQRNYSHTNVEVLYFFMLISIVVLIAFYQSNGRFIHFAYNATSPKTYKTYSLYLILPAILASAILIDIRGIYYRMSDFMTLIVDLNQGAEKFNAATASNDGNILFLIPIKNNVDEYNLRTIDNGLYKAATDLGPTWKSDSYVAKLFPNRWYASNKSNIKVQNKFKKIAFKTKPYEPTQEAIARLQKHYKHDFSSYNCEKPFLKYQYKSYDSLIVCKTYE